MSAITNNTAAANIETAAAAAAANNNGLTIVVKPYGVTVKVGQAGYITEATVCKFNDSRHLAAALLTGGVKLAAKPHLITTLQPSSMGVAYFFHQLDVLMAQGLSGILLGDGVAPHIPEGLWEKKARREMENAKRREIKWVRRAKTAEQEIESDSEEVIEKPMPVEVKGKRVRLADVDSIESDHEEVRYAEGHIKMCQRRLTAALSQNIEHKDDLARLLSHIGFVLEVPANFSTVVSKAIILEKVTPHTLDVMKELRRLNPEFLSILTETMVVFQQSLTDGNIGKDEVALVKALKGLGYNNAELASLLETLVDVLTAM